MNDRIKQPIMLLGMILILLTYAIVLLCVWVMSIIGFIFWRNEIFWDWVDFIRDAIPEMPDDINNKNLK